MVAKRKHRGRNRGNTMTKTRNSAIIHEWYNMIVATRKYRGNNNDQDHTNSATMQEWWTT